MIHPRTILDDLPRLVGVRMLWFDDWYDGPVEGLAEYEGREYWFADVDDFEYTWPQRRYVLHPISPEQAAAEWALHRECQARTGPAGCCHQPACPGPDGPADLEGWWRDHPEPSSSSHVAVPPVGWFTASQ
ncbi:hypothetical protein AB0M47_26370 [Hamadaea sp. NPDC051192]|uniref:hypothetical protein n=1 Tax=Hamadaea sp. NPDC051192 TaxID=3154940 RepID=UPI0034126A87